jgi:beta-glucosidase
VGNFVKGVQSEHIIGDLKHYAINDQESGRNAVNANIDKRSMRETDLWAYGIALGISDAGAVMCSYNRVNGDFACENSYLLTDILKKTFHFKGFCSFRLGWHTFRGQGLPRRIGPGTAGPVLLW